MRGRKRHRKKALKKRLVMIPASPNWIYDALETQMAAACRTMNALINDRITPASS